MGKEHWLRKRSIPILTVLLAVAITVGIFYLYRTYPEWFEAEALKKWGYLGAFLISLISSATIILPVPGIVVLFALGTTLNPVLVGLAGGTGATIGEITGFLAGYGGRGMIQGRGRMYTMVENWMRRWGGWAIFAFAAAPLPLFDIAGVVAGVLGYPVWKFLLVAWPGKCIKYIILVWVGAWGWKVVLP